MCLRSRGIYFDEADGGGQQNLRGREQYLLRPRRDGGNVMVRHRIRQGRIPSIGRMFNGIQPENPVFIILEARIVNGCNMDFDFEYYSGCFMLGLNN